MKTELIFIIFSIQVNLVMLKGFNLINIKWIWVILTIIALRVIQSFVADQVIKKRRDKIIKSNNEVIKILKELSKEDKIDG